MIKKNIKNKLQVYKKRLNHKKKNMKKLFQKRKLFKVNYKNYKNKINKNVIKL